jgi:hypothetical protein
MKMWLVYDWSDGLIGLFDTEEEALQTYEEYKDLNQSAFDGEFEGGEEVIIAKVNKRFYASDTGNPVLKEDEEGNEYPTIDTWWEWKEDVHTPYGIVKP